jgi:PAS domain S-box-containing protein
MEPIAYDRGPPETVDVAGHRAIRQVRDHAMFLVDTRGRAASWNEGVGRILGWAEEEWIGQPLRTAFTPEDVAAGVHVRELLEARSTGRAEDDRWMQRRNGERFFASGAVTRLDDDAGRLVGFLKVFCDCTQRKQADEERERLLAAEQAAHLQAQEQAAVLTAAIEAMPAGVYICGAEGVTRCNARGLSMLGASSLEDLHDRIADLGRRFNVRLERDGPPVPEDRLPFVRALAGEAAELETWATNLTTGEDVFIRATAAPVRIDGQIVGAVAVNTDLTDRLKLEQQRQELSRVETQLRERNEEWRALVQTVRDYAIFTVDVEGRISSWHQGAALMKGYTADEAIGMPYADLFVPEERPWGAKREMDIAARTGEYKGEGKRVRKDGSVIEVAVVLTALRGPRGELLGFLKLTQNITERKRQEAEREELLRHAQTAREEAELVSRSKGEFLATISHELRTPLGAILGWAHLLEKGMSDPDAMKQGLAAITRNARVQVQLIEDLLDMSRIESGQLRLDARPVDLAGVVASALDSIHPAAQAKNIVLRPAIDPAAGLVAGDPGRLQQIVGNLLSNAVKFTPAGGRISVSLSRSGRDVEVAVSDTGQGMDAGFVARAFDRFQQQDASTTRRFGGLGIGLAIVKELTDLHGGSVRAHSAGVGQGSTFVVTLPALADAARAATSSSGAHAGDHEADDHPLEGITVLLIDDEPDARAMAEQVLQAAGARVLAAGSATEGFELFREHRPQAILSDIGMPGHDGYDFLAWVRSLEPAEGGQTPAAAFTAFAQPEDRRRALAVGFQSHLVKPVEPAELVAAVATLAEAGTRG